MKIKLQLLTAVVALTLLPNLMIAQEIKGAQMLMKMQKVEDFQQVEAGDTIITSCPKCQQTYATVVTKSIRGMRGEQIPTEIQHILPTCSTAIKTEGVGKHAVNKVVYTCDKCGSTDVTCSLLKKNGGAMISSEDNK